VSPDAHYFDVLARMCDVLRNGGCIVDCGEFTAAEIVEIGPEAATVIAHEQAAPCS
jgi:hypothetical protein